VVENLAAERIDPNHYVGIHFRPDIEGLRAIAVIFVVLYHAGFPFLQGGFIGVDIFFVVSGYLITTLLTNELNLSGDIDLSRFYARRVRRLLPASTLVVVAVCLTEAILASPLAQYGILKDALATTLYSSNIYFCHLNRSYFFQGTPASPLFHTWSLAVEEQFYLVWPILLLLLTRAGKSVGVTVFFLAVITLVSFAGCVWLTGFNEIVAFFQSPARAWEFSAGGLASFVPIQWLTRSKNLCGWIGITGLLVLTLSATFMTASMRYPGYIGAIPVVATIAALLAGAGKPVSLAAGLLKLRPFQYFGAISYALYLWHWPVLRIARDIFPNNSLALRAGCIVLAVLLAGLTHAVVEKPIRFLPIILSRSMLSLGIAALIMAICIGGFAGWRVALLRSAQYRKFHQVVQDMPSFYASGCSADIRPKLCIFGETSKPVSTVVLFGDSHAAQWFEPLKDIAEVQHWKLVTIIKVACSPMNIKTDHLGSPAAIEGCDQWRKLALAKIREIHPNTVIVSSSSLYPRSGSLSKLIDAPDWERASRETFLALAESGTPVRFIRDTPHADYNVPTCLAQRAWNGRATCGPLLRSSALNSDVYNAEARAATRIANVRFIDMSDAIFKGDRCEPEQGNVVLFRDSDHMTESYAASLASVLQKKLLEESN
jgi:peptidoglycan/LPS O-acetylase OafA/YrhL